jgi:hypothetical protein
MVLHLFQSNFGKSIKKYTSVHLQNLRLRRAVTFVRSALSTLALRFEIFIILASLTGAPWENFWIPHYRMRVVAHFEGRNVVSGYGCPCEEQ